MTSTSRSSDNLRREFEPISAYKRPRARQFLVIRARGCFRDLRGSATSGRVLSQAGLRHGSGLQMRASGRCQARVGSPLQSRKTRPGFAGRLWVCPVGLPSTARGVSTAARGLHHQGEVASIGGSCLDGGHHAHRIGEGGGRLQQQHGLRTSDALEKPVRQLLAKQRTPLLRQPRLTVGEAVEPAQLGL